MTSLLALVKKPSRARRVLSKLRSVARGRSTRRASEPSSNTSHRFVEPIAPVTPSDPPGATIVLLNDCRDQQNYGANALADGLVAILTRSTPNATILPIPS